MKKLVVLSFMLCFGWALTTVNAQVKTPAASPKAKLTQEVGLGSVTIEYNRPSKKGRDIFGGLVPYGEIWRTGANASTKVEFSEDVEVLGHPLKAGKYALYTIPGESTWTIIFHKNLSHWGVGGDNYKKEEDALRVTVKPVTMPEGVSIETFMMTVDLITPNGAEIEILWDNVYVGIPFTVDTDKTVMASIDKTMAGPSSGDYYAAGRYMFESGKDSAKALEMVKKANTMNPDKFWMIRLQSLIEAKLGDTANAIKSAEKSKMLAEKAGNMDYVRLNEKSLMEWAKK